MDIKEENFIHHEIFLLYHKYLYYELSKPIMEDHIFDKALVYGEQLYEHMDKEKYPLNETVFHMVGFDYSSKYWLACKAKYGF